MLSQCKYSMMQIFKWTVLFCRATQLSTCFFVRGMWCIGRTCKCACVCVCARTRVCARTHVCVTKDVMWSPSASLLTLEISWLFVCLFLWCVCARLFVCHRVRISVCLFSWRSPATAAVVLCSETGNFSQHLDRTSSQRGTLAPTSMRRWVFYSAELFLPSLDRSWRETFPNLDPAESMNGKNAITSSLCKHQTHTDVRVCVYTYIQ